MSLSSGLTLTDLSDYLAPSQACIKPVTMVEDTSSTPPPETEQERKSKARTEILIDADSYYEVSGTGGENKKLKKAEITLNDCLACSGCITSAESVLVSLQSHEEVYSTLNSRPDLTPILSISPQSLSSLAALHSLPLSATLSSLRAFFKQIHHFALVFDTSFAREVSLAEGRAELAARAAGKGKGKSTDPILSSACPGWICYAEKTHGALLPLVSTVKSSQATQGLLVKHGLVAERLGLKSTEIYHVSVMPCYDKKLEASRPDFEEAGTRDVDCVLTTGEVESMLKTAGWDLRSASLLPSNTAPSTSTIAPPSQNDPEDSYFPSLLPPFTPGSSSGGYLHNSLAYALSSFTPAELQHARIETVIPRGKGKGEDYEEVSLWLDATAEGGTRKQVFKAAKCYGFRNLQNLVRKVGKDAGITLTKAAARRPMPTARRGAAANAAAGGGGVEKEAFDFVEVMACPSGCVNGGGQVAAPNMMVDEEGMPDVDGLGKWDGGGVKEWVGRVEKFFWSLGAAPSAEDEMEVDMEGVHESVRPYMPLRGTSAVGRLVEQMVEVMQKEGEGRRGLRTEYRAVESEEVNGLAVKW